jgi:hypothetical protein
MTAHIYRPVHLRQRLTLNGKLIGCTDTTTAMFADAVTIGGCRITEAGVRKLSSEPVPDPASPGLSIPQAIAVLWKLRISAADATGQNFDTLRNHLRQGRRIILQHDMFYLNDGCASGHVGHCMLLQEERTFDGKTQILGDNPMCGTAKWYPVARIKAAAEAFGDQSGVPGDGIRFAISKIIPKIA